MNLIKTCVKRPLTIIMIFCVIIVFGYMGYTKMDVALMPDIDMPVATVMTTWSGAGPEDIDSQVTDVIEDAVSGISGVDSVNAISMEGVSLLMLTFDYDIDINEAVNDMRNKVAMAQHNLPDDVGDPTISKVDMNASAISNLVITGDVDPIVMKTYVEDTVVPAIEQVSGVNAASRIGGQESVVNVRVNPDLINRYGISLSTISSVLSSGNLTVPYGTIEDGPNSYTLRTFDKLESVDDIENLQLTASNGKLLTLKDIATVSYEYEEINSIHRYNGVDSLLVSIEKQQSANTVQVMEKVRKTVDRLNKENPDYTIIIGSDESEYISSSINNVWSTMAMSAIVAFIIILLFLKDLKASFLVALAIPLSIVGAVAALFFAGQSLNLITVGGLVLGVGMVVDNSIVVMDNIFKTRETHKEGTLEDACTEGASTVGTAIFASTLTTVAVFLPLLFTSGMVAIMFSALSYSIIFSLMFSILVAMTLVPSLFNLMGHNKKGKELTEKPSPIFDRLKNVYQRFLFFCLGHKLIVIVVSIALLLTSLPLFSTVGIDMMPSADKGTMSISMELPDGVKYEDANFYVTMAEEKISGIEEIESYTTSLDLGGSDMMSMLSDSSTATINVSLVSVKERKRSTKEVSNEVKELLATVPDCDITVSVDDSTMGASMSGFSLEVTGPDVDILRSVALDIEEEISKIEGLTEITDSLTDGQTEARLEIDKDKASDYGVAVTSVTSILRLAIEGSDVTTADIDTNTVDINLSIDDDVINSLDDLLSYTVTSSKGEQIPIGSFAEIKMAKGASQLVRVNGDYTVTIEAELDGLDTTTAQRLCTEAITKMNLPKDYTVGEGTMTEMLNESVASLIQALIIACLLVYMVMVAQFESFKKPFMIIFCIPFGFIGVIYTIKLLGQSLSMPSFIGMILLVGIVVNNGIVLIDYIEQLRAQGNLNLKDCVAQGSASRLRPVLMTTLTTVVAMIPTILGIGEGSETMQPMGGVVAGGLSFSTLVTLILIPTIYLTVESHVEKKHAKKAAKEAKKAAKVLAK